MGARLRWFVVVAAVLTLTSCGSNRQSHPDFDSSAHSFVDELTAKIMRIAHRMPREAQPGARLFAQAGCLTCHSYSGVGSSNLGAPDLTREGIRGKGVAFQI